MSDTVTLYEHYDHQWDGSFYDRPRMFRKVPWCETHDSVPYDWTPEGDYSYCQDAYAVWGGPSIRKGCVWGVALVEVTDGD